MTRLAPMGRPVAERQAIEVRVRYTCGAYVTATVHGRRASSTMSAQQAAIALACKVWDRNDVCVEQVRTGGPGESFWAISEP